MMKAIIALLSLLTLTVHATPKFTSEKPVIAAHLETNGAALCATAKETLSYLNKGYSYDPQVIHEGTVHKIPMAKIKATLLFICKHQHELNNPAFVNQHFDFVRWYPDMQQANIIRSQKSLVAKLPKDKILMTKYYVHLAKASKKPDATRHYPLYALPKDEAHLTLEAADKIPTLTRFQYGKQAILKGALQHKAVPVLAYLTRDDLEAALLQGTVVAELNGPVKTYNVHRNNHIAYDKTKNPYLQDRYWYFKEVNGIKGYGKDAEHKITVNTGVTFAGDLEYFGLGKVLLVQYRNAQGALISKVGIMADTGGAFQNNQYQIDFLTGSYAGKEAFTNASRNLPDYVNAYFMILKD